MDENSRTLRDNEPRQEAMTARNRALFFCVLSLTVGLLGSLFALSCGTVATSPKKEIISEVPEVSTEPRIEHIELEPASNPETNQPEPEKFNEQDCGPVTEAALEKVREENDRLRLEVIRLNADLAWANSEIYSLNRKLDAIFKPEPGGN